MLVPGDTINDHFSKKYMGDTDSLKGKTDSNHYGIFCLKDPDYLIKIISTYYVLEEYPIKKVSTKSFTNITGVSNTEQLKFKITFENHFKYCHAVNDHNNLRKSKPSLESTWVTKI